MLEMSLLKDAERIVRLTMAIILITAGTSKFFSSGSFYNYYSGIFQSDLRIQLPEFVVNPYLSAIPFIELILGFALILPGLKPFTLYAWFTFIFSLLVGHYILQEWSAVNQMLDYVLFGLLGLVLPHHQGLIKRDVLGNSH